MTKSVKRILFVVLICALLISSVCMIALNNKVTYASSVASSLAMEEGASVRISNEVNGIKYTMTMSETDYGDINKKIADGVYSNVSYGILIAPAYYHDIYDLDDPANVFGASAKYNWAVDGVYKEESGKVRITNLSSTTLGEYKNGYAMFASLVGIKPENIANEFIGVGYMKYTEGGTEKYVFTAENDNVRSMAYVAQAYIKDNPTSQYNSVLKSTYLDKVVDVASSFTTEYYLEDAEGNFVKADAESVVTDSTIGATATPVQKEILGYYFDKDNAENSVATEVLANNKTVLKLYYKKAVLNADGTFYNSNFAQVEKPEGAECEKPVGWTYSHVGWEIQSIADNYTILWNGTSLTSSKIIFDDSKKVYASVSVANWENCNLSFTISYEFYNANGELIETKSTNSVACTNSAGAEWLNAQEVMPSVGTAFMRVKLSVQTDLKGYFYGVKLNVIDKDLSLLNADGTFYNSNFAQVEKPEGAECEKPVGWTYSHAGWEIQSIANSNTILWNGTSLTSGKIIFDDSKKVYASVSVANWENCNLSFTISYEFYNANGELIETKSTNSVACTNSAGAEWLNAQEVMPSVGTAFMRVKLSVQTNLKGYFYGVKLNVMDKDFSLLNADGTFYNSDFAQVERPEGAECDKPVGWTYSHAGWEIYKAGGDLIMWPGTWAISSKIQINAGTKLYASVKARDWNDCGLVAEVSLMFYNANGELLATSISSDISIPNADEWKNGEETIAPEGTAYVTVKLACTGGTAVGYFNGVKLIVVE